MKKKAKVVKEEKTEDISVWWEKASYWDALTLDQKKEHYWKFQYIDGKRVLVGSDG